VSDVAIRIVLDTSAVMAYAKGSENVGEVLIEVTDEGGAFAVPVVCLLEGSKSAPEANVRLLTSNPACRVLPLLSEDWPRLLAGVRLLSRLDLATALYAAGREGYVLTGEPDAYGEIGGQAVIEI